MDQIRSPFAFYILEKAFKENTLLLLMLLHCGLFVQEKE